MEFDGTIKGGVVVFSAQVPLPDGTRVRVQPVAEVPSRSGAVEGQAPRAKTLGQRLMKFAGRARGLPRDASRNHDHSLYGTPKR